MAKGKTANPADAFRKALRKKELKKNKDQRAKTRDFALVKKDTSEIEDEIQKLESTPSSDQNRLKELQKELEHINQKKEDYIAEHPEQRKLVYRPRKSQKHEDDAGSQPVKQARNLFDKNGLPRHPERSIYYDPIMNPFGVAPPGMPYMERPLLPDEKDSDAEPNDDDSDDDIAMPAAPPPPPKEEEEEEDDDDDIPMPEGPPPGQSLPPRLPQGPPPLPIPTLGPPGGYPPPPPGMPFPPPPGMPVLPPGFNPAMFMPPPPGMMPPNLYVPPPPPGPPPSAFSGHSFPPPPPGPPRSLTGITPPAFANPPFPPFPPGMPPLSSAFAPPMPPPPPGFFPRRSPQSSAIQDPLSSIPHQTYQAHRAGTMRGHPSLPPIPGSTIAPSASAVVSAEPELRDFKKEATTFVPPSLKRKKAGGQPAAATPGKINAAPSLGPADEFPQVGGAKPDLLDALKDQFGPRPAPASGSAAGSTPGGAQARDDYDKFAADMADLLGS